MARLIVCLLALVAGCYCSWSDKPGTSCPIDAKWRPLERFIVDPAIHPGMVGTRAPNVYTSNLCEFFANFPRDSIRFDALMKHEQLHCVHQLDYPGGPVPFLQSCANDYTGFNRLEEEAGWGVEFDYLEHHGVRVDCEKSAFVLYNNYVYKDVHMFPSYDEALTWVRARVTQARSN